MAARLGLSGHDQLQHFIASPAWDDGPLWAALAREADRLVGGSDACLVIDDTALPKKGTLSVWDWDCPALVDTDDAFARGVP